MKDEGSQGSSKCIIKVYHGSSETFSVLLGIPFVLLLKDYFGLLPDN